jgi:hypothetical protein
MMLSLSRPCNGYDRISSECLAVGEMRTGGGNQSTWKKKPCQSATFSTTNPLWPALGCDLPPELCHDHGNIKIERSWKGLSHTYSS